MSVDIFSNMRGVVSAFDVDTGIPCNMYVEGWAGFYGFKSIITEFRVQAQGGVQFLHTLRDFIYIYVFGERIGQASVSGLSFWDTCDGGGVHGLEWVNYYYLQNRVSQRATPVTIILGSGTPFYGFLTGLTLDLNNPENLIGQYALNFNVIPEQSSLSGMSGEADGEEQGGEDAGQPAAGGAGDFAVMAGAAIGAAVAAAAGG
jgi:hypothetical protein